MKPWTEACFGMTWLTECVIWRLLTTSTGLDVTVSTFNDDNKLVAQWHGWDIPENAPRLTSHQVQACAALFGDLFTDEIRAMVEDREEARAVGMRDRVEALTGRSISLTEARALVIAARSDQ